MDYNAEAADFEQRVKDYINFLRRETVNLVVEHYIGNTLVNTFVIYDIDTSSQLAANAGIRRIAGELHHTVDVRVIKNEKSSADEEPQKG